MQQILKAHQATANLHLLRWNSLCQDVHSIVCSRDIGWSNHTDLYLVPEPKEMKIEMLHASMVLCILANCNSRLDGSDSAFR